MTSSSISVIIIFHGRHKHLQNVLKGLELGSVLPDEVILVEMAEIKSTIANYNLQITHHLISDFENGMLPLARARNFGALKAQFEILAFLDVDCIPSPDYISEIKKSLKNSNALYMGRPLYLSKEIEFKDFVGINDYAIQHPIRPNFSDTIQIDDYGQFWSLCFYITSSLFFEIGGFDESYVGYGGEDTDFAFKCQEHNIPFFLTDNDVYHQQHSFMRPPLNSLKAIVENSNYFYSKWSIWPMLNHLQMFNDLKFIEWNSNQSDSISIIKNPEQSELDAALINDEPYS